VVTSLIPAEDGGIANYTMPPTGAYPLDIVTASAPIPVRIVVTHEDGCRYEIPGKVMFVPGGDELGPHRVIPDWPPNYVLPHDDYTVTIYAADDGRPLSNPSYPHELPMGSIEFGPGYVVDEDTHLANYIPPYGYDPEFGRLEVWIGSELVLNTTRDNAGGIHLPQPFDTIGTYEATVIVYDMYSDHVLASNSVPITVKAKGDDEEDGDLVIISIEVYKKGVDNWIKIEVLGCVNVNKDYALMGSPVLVAKGEPEYGLVEDSLGFPIIYPGTTVNDGLLLFDFPMPQDGGGLDEKQYFFYAIGWE
jgi:hypothetical protein